MAKEKTRVTKSEVSQGAEHTLNNDEVNEEPTAQTMFRCTPTQKKAFSKRAKSLGLSSSAYIRSLIARDGGFN